MLIVDAGVLFEVVAATPESSALVDRLAEEPEQFAPQLIDVEVFSVIRRQHSAGRLDATAARQAVADLQDWPGERIGHRLFFDRAWELRDNVRGADAMYVALAEAMDGVLLTTDARLSRATGIRCRVEVVPTTA